MIHLKKFNESSSEDKQDILDNFTYISDRFGEPEVLIQKYGKGVKWNLSWDIKLNLSVLQEATQLVQKLKDIVEDIDDVLSAGERLEKYNINMSLTDCLKIVLIPKDSGDDTFKFIRGFKDRELLVRINEIERFFNSKGIRVLKWDQDSSYNEINQTNELEVVLNKRDDRIIREFYNLIMQELNLITDREYQVRTEGNIDGFSICIYPDDEKSYVSAVTN